MEKKICECRKKQRTEAEYKSLLNRLSRIEGQVRGIRNMVEQDIYCTDILMQVAAVTAALNSFNKELLAALLSGDQKTFELFRCQAPELVHLPEATYDWYSRNYLDQYYPVRFMMRLHGVTFPTWRG